MPMYYFDVDDGSGSYQDTEGTDLADDLAARREARGLLPNLARDLQPDRDSWVLTIIVRDENRIPIFFAGLTQSGHWLDDRAN